MAAEEKSIAKSIDAMQRYAKTKQFSGMAMVSDQEGYNIVLQYFGCWGGEPYEIPPETEHKPYVPPARTQTPTAKPTTSWRGKKKESPEQLSLFDLLDEPKENDREFKPDADDEEGIGCGC